MGGAVVPENQGVLPVHMLEEVVDALQLEQTIDEVEIGLPILHAIGPLPVAAGETILEVREAQLAEDLLDDVGDFLVLKDSAVRGPREEPEPRDQGRAVKRIGSVEAKVGEAAHVPVEEPLAAVGQQKRHGGRGAEQVVGAQVAALAEEVQVILERGA